MFIPDLDRFVTVRSDEVEHRPILIEPFIREGDLVMFTGAPGQGKSTLIADLALALLLPEDVPGHNVAAGGLFRVDRALYGRRRVVLLDAENEPAEWSELIEQSAMARGIPGDDPRLEFCLAGFRWRRCHDYDWDDLAASESTIGLLCAQLEALQTGVVIIDSLHKAWRKRLNDPDWVTRGLGVLKEQLRNRNITLICLVHTSRDYKDKLPSAKYLPSYTAQQEKEADTIIGLKRIVKEDALKLVLVKRRAAKWNPEGTVVKVGLSQTFGGYTTVHDSWAFVNPKGLDEPGVHLMAHQRRLLASLPPAGPFTYEDIPMSRQKAPGAVQPLVNVGILERDGRGVRGDPYRFSMTDLGRKLQDSLRNGAGEIYSGVSPEEDDEDVTTGQVDPSSSLASNGP